MAQRAQRKYGERLANAISRAAQFSRLGVSIFSRARWALIGAFYNRLTMPPASALLMGRHAFRLPTGTGGQLSVGFRDFDDLITFEAVFMWHHYPLQSVGFEPDTIIDCGAHVGFFTCLSAVTFPTSKLVCIEPNPENHRRLTSHIKRNGIRAELIEAAAALEDGSRLFSGHGIRGAVVPEGRQDAIRVRAVCLNDIIARQGTKRLVLKMDIEGAEHELLPAAMPFFPVETAVFIEWHGTAESWGSAMEMMRAAGFETTVILDQTVEPGGQAVAAFVRHAARPRTTDDAARLGAVGDRRP